ncbi:hypothetical protein MMC26_006098 [Xylographa opegraphella]|nr:hypothetical protein [Xylographa opegraphella]
MPPTLTQPQISQHVYSAQASTYDDSWHVSHAGAFPSWAGVSPGQHVLDLACGTGLATILAAVAAGPSGSATGIDVCAEMLTVAQRKAAQLPRGPNIAFVQHDITQLAGLGLRPAYDAITCASALPWLEDPRAAVGHWAAFLASGGRLVVDVPTERSQLPGLVFEHVAAEVGVALPFGRRWIRGPEALEGLVAAAGLRVERSFVARGYASARVYGVGEGGELFDRWVAGPLGQLHPRLAADVETRARARTLFVEQFASRAGPDGMVREEEGFYVVVGRKP